MKKVLVIISILFCSYKLQAQSNLFIKGGLANSDIIFANTTNKEYSNKFGPQVGMIYSYKIHSRWNVRAELLYTVKGNRFNGSRGTGQIINLYFLNLPLLAGYNIGKFNVELGPEFGYLLNASFQDNGQFSDAKELFNEKFELAASLGISYEAFDRLLLNVRYSRGLTRIGEVYGFDSGSTISPMNLYSHSFQLSAAFRIF